MTCSAKTVEISLTVPTEMAGRRLDQIASDMIQDYSRSRLQQWIRDGQLRVDGNQKKPKDKLFGKETITIQATLEAEGLWQAEKNVDFETVYQDEGIIIINKPAGLVVHPAAGNRAGTLLNGLLQNWPELETVPRAGIVHRLDKDTTGLMVVAKTLQAHTRLVRQLQKRAITREYEAVVIGVMTGGGSVDAAIGRHPKIRTRMAVIESGKPAVTHYRVKKRFRNHTHIRVKLETGRTHQIRVHMAHIGYPLVGDTVYAGRFKIPQSSSPEFLAELKGFGRQALHAATLGLTHPITGEDMVWHAPLPEDFQTLLKALKTDAREHDENG